MQRPREEEQNEADYRGGRELRNLAARAGTLAHGSLRQAATHNESSARHRSGVGRCQSENVGVLVDTLSVANSEDAGRRSALRNNDHKARPRNGKDRE